MVDGLDLSNIFGVDVNIEATKEAIENALQKQAASGVGGDEIIEGGKPHVMQSPGRFTTPTLPLSRTQGQYPTSGSGAYPAITYLCDVVVVSPGIRYSESCLLYTSPSPRDTG